MAATMTDRPTLDAGVRSDRLSSASLRRVLEPEELFDWGSLGSGQLVSRELSSAAGLGLDLTDEQWTRLSREEVAAIVDAGIRFETMLMAGFGLQIARSADLADPRITYMLHEMGEETRHSRAFARLLDEIGPTAVNPLNHPVIRRVTKTMTNLTINSPVVLCVMVLAGEEIPDLIQKRAVEHPDTDPLLAAVNRYHRQEEARHLAFARMVLPELYAEASAIERWRIRTMVPVAIGGLFDTLVHPGVYETVGLAGWETWKRVKASPQRVALRHEALRPVLGAVVDAGIFSRSDIPKGWQKLCGVDAGGQPIAA